MFIDIQLVGIVVRKNILVMIKEDSGHCSDEHLACRENMPGLWGEGLQCGALQMIRLLL